MRHLMYYTVNKYTFYICQHWIIFIVNKYIFYVCQHWIIFLSHKVPSLLVWRLHVLAEYSEHLQTNVCNTACLMRSVRPTHGHAHTLNMQKKEQWLVISPLLGNTFNDVVTYIIL